jgi:hypothetical protein
MKLSGRKQHEKGCTRKEKQPLDAAEERAALFI